MANAHSLATKLAMASSLPAYSRAGVPLSSGYGWWQWACAPRDPEQILGAWRHAGLGPPIRVDAPPFVPATAAAPDWGPGPARSGLGAVPAWRAALACDALAADTT